MLEKVDSWRRRQWQRMKWLDGITDSVICIWVNSRSWWWTGKPGVLQSLWSQRVRRNSEIELQKQVLLLLGRSHQVNTYLTELWRNMSLLIYTCVKRRWSRSKLLIHSHCPSSLQSGLPELATWPVVPRVGVVGWETLSGQHGTFSIFMRDGEITRDCFYTEIGDWHIYLAQQMERF